MISKISWTQGKVYHCISLRESKKKITEIRHLTQTHNKNGHHKNQITRQTFKIIYKTLTSSFSFTHCQFLSFFLQSEMEFICLSRSRKCIVSSTYGTKVHCCYQLQIYVKWNFSVKIIWSFSATLLNDVQMLFFLFLRTRLPQNHVSCVLIDNIWNVNKKINLIIFNVKHLFTLNTRKPMFDFSQILLRSKGDNNTYCQKSSPHYILRLKS